MRKEEIKSLLSQALKKSVADEVEILLMRSQGGLSRFANSIIHQSINRKDDYLQVRSIINKKIGVASTNDLNSLDQTIKKADEAANLASETKDFVSLPKDGSIEADEFHYSSKTAAFSPEDRAVYIRKLVDKAKNYKAAGILETGESEMAIVNSNSIFSYQKQTEAEMNTIFYNDSESSFAYMNSFDAEKIDPQEIGNHALKMVINSANPTAIAPGNYTVILKPAAVADMLSMLAFAGLSALALQENRSFMNANISKLIASEKVNLFDDASNEESLGWLFDYEGVKRQRVDFIKNGIAKDVVYDSFTANRANHVNTGHALPASSKFGPLPFNIILQPGDCNIEQMISTTKKGLLINRFHYTNLENPMETMFTGMTRDGTFLIENGKILKPIINMRFTQSIIDALLNIVDISKKAMLSSGLAGYYYVPTLKISKFNFSSSSTS